MKVNKWFVCFLLGTLSLLSCMSYTYYGTDTSAFKVCLSGRIISTSKQAGLYDIVLDGKHKMVWGFNNLFSGKTEFLKWQGTIHLGESIQDLVVEYEQRSGDNNDYSLYAIKTNILSPIYNFENFDLQNGNYLFSKRVYEKDMPCELTRFSVGGKEFSLVLRMMVNGFGSRLHMMIDEKQVFQIVGEDKQVYAEFDKYAYQIFAVDAGFDPEYLWPCIAAFSVIRDLADYPNDALFQLK